MGTVPAPQLRWPLTVSHGHSSPKLTGAPAAESRTLPARFSCQKRFLRSVPFCRSSFAEEELQVSAGFFGVGAAIHPALLLQRCSERR